MIKQLNEIGLFTATWGVSSGEVARWRTQCQNITLRQKDIPSSAVTLQ